MNLVCHRDDLWEGEMRPLELCGRRIVLVNVDGTVSAFLDRCAHLGAAISSGELREGIITCAAHEWQYDAKTGKGVNPENTSLVRLPVVIKGEEVWVDVQTEPS